MQKNNKTNTKFFCTQSEQRHIQTRTFGDVGTLRQCQYSHTFKKLDLAKWKNPEMILNFLLKDCLRMINALLSQNSIIKIYALFRKFFETVIRNLQTFLLFGCKNTLWLIVFWSIVQTRACEHTCCRGLHILCVLFQLATHAFCRDFSVILEKRNFRGVRPNDCSIT